MSVGRATYVVGVILLISIVAFVGSNLMFPNKKLTVNGDLPKPLPFTLCDLVEKPQQFDGRMVRLRSHIEFGLEGIWFSDANCVGDENSTTISYLTKDANLEIDRMREQNSKDGKLPLFLDVEVEGKFKNQLYKDCCLIAPFQFELIRVESKFKSVNADNKMLQ